MIFNNKEYVKEDTVDKLTIPDDFVIRDNKIGTGNGHKKLYIGQNNDSLRNFYGTSEFTINCILKKKDLKNFLIDLESEYKFPTQSYRRSHDLPSLFTTRLQKIDRLPEELLFSVSEQGHIEGPRVYIRSNASSYEILRELPLPNLSYLSIMKLKAADGDIIYYFKLFTDYESSFGSNTHPSDNERENETLSNDDTISERDREQMIKARIGQGKYRKDLLRECPKCPITLIEDHRLLTASHIKPWAKSIGREKIDPKNGFMFTPTIDRLFDRGLITFENNKKIFISPWLPEATVSRLNIQKGSLIESLPIEGREKYLSYHREKIFKF
tara:strand:+ start:376 stop:1356 length:981 start_codon:yes stop_codon:yes gene_type:complete